VLGCWRHAIGAGTMFPFCSRDGGA
jgi:hypothetical protein